MIALCVPLVMDLIMMNDTDSSDDEPTVPYNDSSDVSISEDMDSDDSEYIPQRNPISSSSSQGTQNAEPNSVLQVVSAAITGPPLKSEPNIEKNAATAEPVEGASAVKSTPRDSGEDDGQWFCTICFEPWTSSSIHRLVSLRCGHLFGRSCITRWLKGQNSRCPQCNARARKSEIRNIYAKAVKVLDSTERDNALLELTKEKELRRKAEIEASQARLKHLLAAQECERLKAEVMAKEKVIQEYRSAMKSSNISQSAKPATAFFLEKVVDIIKTGGCRIVDSSDLLGMILVSQPSTNPLYTGYGIRKISCYDLKPSEFCLIHTKAIKDMAFHDNDGLVLTASLDKTLKITNMITNCQVQTYKVESDVWSCAWDADDPMYFYGGLKTGEVYVFDIRVTSRHVYQLPRFGAKTPVASLQYLKSPAMSVSPRKCGPIVGKLSDCALQQKTDIPDFYKIVSLPLLGPLFSLSSHNSGDFLVSSRPSKNQSRVNHTLCNFMANASGDLICNPVMTVLGGANQPQLTRSKLLSHPDKETSVLVCASDTDARGALIWDGSNGNCIDRLQTNSPVVDFTGLKINHKSILAALTEETLRLYKWTGNV